MTTTEPWNEWHGLTEGDMLVELAEHEQLTCGIDYRLSYAFWSQKDHEEIRKAWWEAIGRHYL